MGDPILFQKDYMAVRNSSVVSIITLNDIGHMHLVYLAKCLIPVVEFVFPSNDWTKTKRCWRNQIYLIFHDNSYLYTNVSSHFQDAKGSYVDLGIYKGKVLLIVNVASKWYSSFASFYMKVIRLNLADFLFNLKKGWFYYLGLIFFLIIFSFVCKTSPISLSRIEKYLCCLFVDSCSGMTNSNYIELNQLYEKYKDQGLHLILCVIALSFYV